MADDALLHRVADALGLQPSKPAPPGGLLVAWSGGLDSSVLLDLLERLSRRHGFELAAVHVDHGLRPDSRDDAAFCTQEAARRGLAFRLEHITVRKGHSTQSQARAQRYAAIAEAADALGLATVVTAHHADDALETALLNLSRGTGLRGLVSLSAPGDSPGIARPLLTTRRAEIEAYASQRALRWIDDPTNLEDHYERNRLRHQVLPALVDARRGSAPLLASLANLRQDSDALQYYARALSERARRDDEPGLQTIAFDRQVLAGQPAATIALALRQVHDGWSMASLGAVVEAIGQAQSGQTIAIAGATVIVRAHRVVIEPTRGRGPQELAARQAFAATVAVGQPGELPWFGWHIGWQLRARTSGDEQPVPACIARFDAELLPQTLIVRGPQESERLVVEGMDGRKRLKDLFAAHGVASDERWRWPCLAAADKLLWVCAIRRSADFALTPATTTVLEIRCEQPTEGEEV
ncbi:MAG: tRNA lysidine(34) synthetase TilS [Bradymonadaceae bacterium]|nr:tRNA lysidine(34) synthetase TilS [Lujinxingiaceae bacterium]